jgi:hypothetical protein
MQAAGYVQPRGGKSLLVQVRAQLSKMARETRERDKRYQAAKEAGSAKKLGAVLGHVLRSSPYHDNTGGPKAFAEYTARMISEGKFDPKSKLD